MSLEGFHEWTPEEYAEKEAAMAAVPLPLLSLVAGKSEGDYNLDFSNRDTKAANYVNHQRAINAIFAWSKFPKNLLPLFNAIIGASAGTNQSFTATDLQLGKELNIGRKAKSQTVRQSFTRAKKKFREWQIENEIEIIKISGKVFNPQKQRNEPTEYQVFINDWVIEVLAEAQNKYKSDWQGRNKRLLAIQKAARDIIQKHKNSPLFESVRAKTFSESQLHNRDILALHNLIDRIIVRLHRSNMSWELFLEELELEIKMRKTNQPGTIGKLLTPESDEPRPNNASWESIKTGDIEFVIKELKKRISEKENHLESVGYDRVEYAAQSVQSENREIEVPRSFAGGKWSSYSNDIPVRNADLPMLQNDTDFCRNQTENDCNSLNPLSLDATFLNAKNDTGQSVSYTEINEAINVWAQLIKERLPDAMPSDLDSGVFQLYRFDSHTNEQKKAENQLAIKQDLYFLGRADLSELHSAFLDWVMSRVTFWKNKKETAVKPEKLTELRANIAEFLEFGDG